MVAEKILSTARALGVSIRTEAGQIIARPKEAVTDDLRALIRANKAELLKTLSNVPGVTDVTRPIGEEPTAQLSNVVPIRQLRPDLCDMAIDTLKKRKELNLYAEVDAEVEGPVVVAVAQRSGDGSISCREVLIAKEQFDLERFLQLIDKYSRGDPQNAEHREAVAA